MKQLKKITEAAFLLGLTTLSPTLLGAEEEMEQVIVTGSYIRGTPGDAPSPVQTLQREDIVISGVSDVSEMIRNLEIASGSDTAPQNETRFNGNSGSGLANDFPMRVKNWRTVTGSSMLTRYPSRWFNGLKFLKTAVQRAMALMLSLGWLTLSPDPILRVSSYPESFSKLQPVHRMTLLWVLFSAGVAKAATPIL